MLSCIGKSGLSKASSSTIFRWREYVKLYWGKWIVLDQFLSGSRNPLSHFLQFLTTKQTLQSIYAILGGSLSFLMTVARFFHFILT